MSKNKNNLLRVTQMNAIYLDKEILKSFINCFRECYKYLSPGLTAPFEEEINALVRLLILSYSVGYRGNTFGQQLLSIKYNNMSIVHRMLYVLYECSGYLNYKFNLTANFFTLYSLFKLAEFLNTSVFLRTGSKPLLIDRLLGLTQVYDSDSGPRQFQSKYLARELLWNGFIDIFVHLIPLINFHKLRRTVRNLNPLHKKPVSGALKIPKMTMHTKCGHCGENPILPHHMGCDHIFCYVCLKGNFLADPKYECPICGCSSKNGLCERVKLLK